MEIYFPLSFNLKGCVAVKIMVHVSDGRGRNNIYWPTGMGFHLDIIIPCFYRFQEKGLGDHLDQLLCFCLFTKPLKIYFIFYYKKTS